MSDDVIERATEAAMRGMVEVWRTDDAELFAEVALGAVRGLAAAGLLASTGNARLEQHAYDAAENCRGGFCAYCGKDEERHTKESRCAGDHTEVRLYAPCVGHDHLSDDPGVLDIDGDLSCDDGHVASVCSRCCVCDDHTSDAHNRDHTGPCWPCPAVTPASKPTQSQEATDA